MRLVGATVARNEGDVIEIFVRHNLTVLDGLAIVDHGSIDGTPEILAALVREGLPLFVARDESADFDGRAMVNRLVRHVFATSDADWVFPLDADEFVKTRSRAALEKALRAMGDGRHAMLDWQTYVPRFDGADLRAAIAGARRLARERHGFAKVAVQRRFAETPNLVVAKGSHGVSMEGPMPVALAGHRLDPVVAALAHVPVRGAAQFGAKVAVGWLSTLASDTFRGGDSTHWKEAYAYLRSGRPLTPLQLQSFAANYGVLQDRWLPVDAIETVEDPFLADVACSWSGLAHVDPLPLVLAHAERLLAELRARHPAPAGTTAARTTA